MLEESIAKLQCAAEEALRQARDLQEVEQLRVRYLGKQGEITSILKQLKQASVAEKKVIGQLANQAKQKIAALVQDKLQLLKQQQLELKLAQEHIDVSLPGRSQAAGSLHPVTLTQQRVVLLLGQLGFEVVAGPEIEDDYHNFAALNIPDDHPARAMQDTFYFGDGLLLRTHTSSVQIRVMEQQSPPLRIITPGRVYRRDSDQTHTPMFHQIEGLLVDNSTNFIELQATLRGFLEAFFGCKLALRVRPSYFPFTEPSAEIDIAFNRHTRRVTAEVNNDTQWLEVLGCGMVHPNVLQAANINPDEYQGFAFGVGLDRLAMLRYGIADLRLMFEHDINFLSQFTDFEGCL